ncbi:MAG: hypothetical protein DRJ64_09360, partial [Thermoprotei archaeon]
MYLSRFMEKSIIDALKYFPVVALTGARQTGKSTMLKQLLGDSFAYISLDDFALRSQAKESPSLLLKNFQQDLIIDEIQYAPELLTAIKISVDSGETRKFVVTGSQQFNMIKGLQESLAGRVLLLNLYPMTAYEKSGFGNERHWLYEILTHNRVENKSFKESGVEPAEELLRGGLPGLINKPDNFISPYFDSYLKTYIERDIPELYGNSNAIKLASFIQMLAPLSSQMINKNELSKHLGVSAPTINRWLEWFSTGFVYASLRPYLGNMIKRLSKMPKGTLFDSGLIAHLMQIGSKESLLVHPQLGALFESRVVHEMRAVISSHMI